MTKRDWWKK